MDGFAVPLVREQTIQVDAAFFDEYQIPGGTRLDDLLGWRRQRFPIESMLEGYAGVLPLDLTFRLVGSLNVLSLIDNVELSGKVSAPCISGAEFSCLGRLVEDTQRLLDNLGRPFELELLGPGTLITDVIGLGDDIDPHRFQDHIQTEIIGADPESTILRVIAERPGDFTVDSILELGTIRSSNGLLKLDFAGVPAVRVRVETSGPIRDMVFDGLADGSLIEIGGLSSQLTKIAATSDIGSVGGFGVALRSTGQIEFQGKSWLNGSWDVSSVTTADVVGGDFTPQVAILGGFDTFSVSGGNFAPPNFASGLGPAYRGWPWYAHPGTGRRTGQRGLHYGWRPVYRWKPWLAGIDWWKNKFQHPCDEASHRCVQREMLAPERRAISKVDTRRVL